MPTPREPRLTESISFDELLVGLDHDPAEVAHPFGRLEENRFHPQGNNLPRPAHEINLRKDDNALVYEGAHLTADSLPTSAVIRGLWRLAAPFLHDGVQSRFLEVRHDPYAYGIQTTPEAHHTLAKLGLCSMYADVVTGQNTDLTGKPSPGDIDRVYFVERPFEGNPDSLYEKQYVVLRGYVKSYEPTLGQGSENDKNEGYLVLETDSGEQDIFLTTEQSQLLLSAEKPSLQEITIPLPGDLIHIRAHHAVDIDSDGVLYRGFEDHEKQPGFALIEAGDERLWRAGR